MKVKNALSQIDKFCKALNIEYPEMSFPYEIVASWEGPFKNWFRKEVPGIGFSKKSGVYIFSDNESNILYIGKAASENFGAEIYGKFSSATEVDEKDVPYFGNSSMAKWAPDNYRNFFLEGNVFISAVSIEPKEFSSLVEVLLHVWCATNEGLPPLNKQIG